MQHYNTAKEILEASLRDIERGRWLCGTLAQSKIDGKEFMGCYIVEDEPMGCALGLIAAHGGHGVTETVTFAGKEWDTFIPAYPHKTFAEVLEDRISEIDGLPHRVWVKKEIGPAPDAVLEARDALMHEVLERRRDNLDEYDMEFMRENPDDTVYGYNDDFVGSAEAAAEWFRAALATLDAPVAA